MNQRVRELAEQATIEMDPEAFSEDMNIPPEWYQKFAELIVQECANRCLEMGYVDPQPHHYAISIKEHFGVKS
jgi:hypothetical protein